MAYLPVALRLDGRRCVVVGGGSVAARRVEALLEAGAVVRVAAPEACAEIRAWATAGRIEYLPEPYQPDHLSGAFLVISATDRPEINTAILADAHRSGALVNDAEDSDRGDFVVPSMLRRGNLLLAVTTLGQSPALAARIRDDLAARFGPEYTGYVALLGELRSLARRTIPDPRRRRVVLSRLAREERVLTLLKEGRAEEARSLAFACISSPSD